MKKLNTNSNATQKQTISRDRLNGDEFDRLVIEISKSIYQRECSTIVPNGREHLQNGFALEINEDDSGSLDNYHSQQLQISQVAKQLSQPKRPMNAFMVWGRAIRRELHDRFSNVQNALLSKALGRVWKTLDSIEKEPYVRKANLIKANHKRDYPNYRYQPRRTQERPYAKGDECNFQARLANSVYNAANAQLVPDVACPQNRGCYSNPYIESNLRESNHLGAGGGANMVRTLERNGSESSSYSQNFIPAYQFEEQAHQEKHAHEQQQPGNQIIDYPSQAEAVEYCWTQRQQNEEAPIMMQAITRPHYCVQMCQQSLQQSPSIVPVSDSVTKFGGYLTTNQHQYSAYNTNYSNFDYDQQQQQQQQATQFVTTTESCLAQREQQVDFEMLGIDRNESNCSEIGRSIQFQYC